MAPKGSERERTDGSPPKRIRFIISGQIYTVGPDISPSMTLVDFIREKANLPGTKVLCREGGCGVCTVVATVSDPVSGTRRTFSAKSCQTLVYACSGWNIETIEFLGDRYKGYHTLQKALKGFYGTQCGYCSPGFIMTMYGVLKSKGSLTMEQVEKSMDGNLCRCTGYRPILDAFKSLASDADPGLKKKLLDIEEAYKTSCPKTGKACKGHCSDAVNATCDHLLPSPCDDMCFDLGTVQWYRPVTVKGIYNVLNKVTPEDNVRIVVGNTGQGVYKDDGPFTVYINTTGIRELYQERLSDPLFLGANVSLTRCIEVLNHMAENFDGYRHAKVIADHWGVVANVGVRNIGCWAANLMMKHDHPEFPSDIFVTLNAADASLRIGHAEDESTTEVSLEEFLKMDMSKKIIISMTLPPMPNNTHIRTFKITPRSVNAHAYVNSAFRFEFNPVDFTVTSAPVLLFGGINPKFVRATATEQIFKGKKLTDPGLIQQAMTALKNELHPDNKPQDASPEYRVSLSQSLLYKTLVGFLGDFVDNEIHSAGPILKRPISRGEQSFDQNEDTWPVGEAIPKLDSSLQISGEAQYLNDIPLLHNELHGVFVQSDYAVATIQNIDATEALKVPGVIDFVTAGDIPGKNSFIASAAVYPDPIFASGSVSYAGQAVGLVVAKTRSIAVQAAKLVKVTYSDIKKPVLTIKEAIKKGHAVNETNSVTGTDDAITYGNIEGDLSSATNMVEGELELGSQFHMTMEPLAGRCVPIEDGYDVCSTSQWPTETQAAICQALNVPAHRVNITVRRIGGGYGGKISRQNVVACAAAVASHKTELPVRVVLDLQTHMTLVGWREPYYSKYKVGFDDVGKLKGVQVELYSDAGYVRNEASSSYGIMTVPNVYFSPSWKLLPKSVVTDTAANTWCRTPGPLEGIAAIENIMEHISAHLKKDPLEVREVNLIPDQTPEGLKVPKGKNGFKNDILPLLKQKAMVAQRKEEVAMFNKANRWRKRGLSVVPMFYEYGYPPFFRYQTQVTIYEADGTVAISHGGIEMGQGVNTKAAQVAAHVLNIPLEKVVVKPTDSIVGANSTVTGGSFGSDLVAHGVRVCCERLQERISDVRKKMDKEKEHTWEEVIKKCVADDVDICERYWTVGKEHPMGYDIWGGVCLEVEVDVLTGQFLVLRADLIEDCGRSLSPYVDIGQVEGAFVMGLGYFTSELVKFDEETGQKLSSNTWEYKPPFALDIPIDMRVTLLPNASNEFGVLRSKATGEPPLCLSYSVVSALRNAISAARADAGISGWFDMHTPLTVEKIHQLCMVNAKDFILRRD